MTGPTGAANYKASQQFIEGDQLGINSTQQIFESVSPNVTVAGTGDKVQLNFTSQITCTQDGGTFQFTIGFVIDGVEQTSPEYTYNAYGGLDNVVNVIGEFTGLSAGNHLFNVEFYNGAGATYQINAGKSYLLIERSLA